MTRSLFGWLLAWLLVACGGAPATSTEAPPPEGTGDEGGVVLEEGDDPRVSTSAGQEGGIVVLWPRVIGLAESEGETVQGHVVGMARRLFPEHPLDIRPDPERVCPRTGCLGTSLGALLIVQNGQCAVVGIVGRPGQGNLTLVSWAGTLDIRERNVPFRQPPESHITLRDRIPCSGLEEAMRERDADMEAAMRDVVPRMAL